MYLVKLGALLHDVGKLLCWAKGDKLTEHPRYTELIVAKSLENDKLAEIASRHHGRLEYKPYRPRTTIERIVDLADDIAAGADRREERRAALREVRLSYPVLPKGELGDPVDLKIAMEGVRGALTECAGRPWDETYSLLVDKRGKFRRATSQVPAHSAVGINDHSLWSHLKLTAAIATCIFLEGFRGSASKQRFSIVSGDADRVGDFMARSYRLPDLVAGSDLVKEATEKATGVIKRRLGSECVIFEGGGNFLAVTPPSIAPSIVKEAKVAFEEVTDQELTITIGSGEYSGDKLKKFAEVWREIRPAIRRAKPFATRIALAAKSGEEPCDVCRLRPGKAEPRLRPWMITRDAYARHERLCDICLRRRAHGLQLERKDLDEVADDYGFVALIMADGDDLGEWFRARKLGKDPTPARFDWLSETIDQATKVAAGAARRKGAFEIYSGGDDILLVSPGAQGLDVAYEVATKFHRELKEKITMSIGVAIFKYKFPLYAGIALARALLRSAKSLSGKFGVDFEVIEDIGIAERDLLVHRREQRESKLTGRPLKVDKLKSLFEMRKWVREGFVNLSQLHTLSRYARMIRHEEGRALVRNWMGRGCIEWRIGEELVQRLQDGTLLDSLHLLTTVWR